MFKAIYTKFGVVTRFWKVGLYFASHHVKFQCRSQDILRVTSSLWEKSKKGLY